MRIAIVVAGDVGTGPPGMPRGAFASTQGLGPRVGTRLLRETSDA